jgi:hypothetical protein
VIKVLREWRLECPKGPLGLVFPDDDGGNPEPLDDARERASSRGPCRWRPAWLLRKPADRLLRLAVPVSECDQLFGKPPPLKAAIDFHPIVVREQQKAGVISC